MKPIPVADLDPNTPEAVKEAYAEMLAAFPHVDDETLAKMIDVASAPVLAGGAGVPQGAA